MCVTQRILIFKKTFSNNKHNKQNISSMDKFKKLAIKLMNLVRDNIIFARLEFDLNRIIRFPLDINQRQPF